MTRHTHWRSWARRRSSTTSSTGPLTDGESFIPEQVYPVVEILLEYLAATGAVSTPAEPDPPTAP